MSYDAIRIRFSGSGLFIKVLHEYNMKSEVAFFVRLKVWAFTTFENEVLAFREHCMNRFINELFHQSMISLIKQPLN